MKPCYITMTQRQNNNEWSGGIAAHTVPKNSVCKNLLEKFSPRFFGITTASSSLSFKTPNYQPGVLLISAGVIEGHFEGKTTESSPMGSCSCTTMPLLTGRLQPRRNWPT
jgi:hypothetical protein